MIFLSDFIVSQLLKNGTIEEHEEDIYKYLIQVRLEQLLGFSIILVLSVYFGVFCQTIIFIVYFCNIRKCSGGYHAKSFYGCMFCSAFVYCIFVKVVYPTLLNTSGCVTFMIISFFLIMIIGSVNHPDMNWDKDEYAMCKKTTRIIALIEIGGIVAFYFMGVSASYILFMCFAMILDAVMLLLAKIMRQEVKISENKNGTA